MTPGAIATETPGLISSGPSNMPFKNGKPIKGAPSVGVFQAESNANPGSMAEAAHYPGKP